MHNEAENVKKDIRNTKGNLLKQPTDKQETLLMH